jgi:DNA-binding MarR family transcriptional regulator
MEYVDRRLRHEARIRSAHHTVLVELSEAPGRRLRMTELAACAQMSPSGLSHVVDRLQSFGWVRREACATDRRGQVAVLTDGGLDALARAEPVHIDAIRRVFCGRLTAEQQRELRAIMEALGRGVRRASGWTAEPAQGLRPGPPAEPSSVTAATAATATEGG